MFGRLLSVRKTAGPITASALGAKFAIPLKYPGLRFSRQWISPLEISGLVIVIDICLVALAGKMSHDFVYPDREINPIELSFVLFAAAAVFGVLQFFGFYSPERLLSRRVGVRRLSLAVLLACGIISMIVLLMNAGFSHGRNDDVEWLMMKPLGEYWTLAFLSTLFPAVVAGRVAFARLIPLRRLWELSASRSVVVGAGLAGRNFVDYIRYGNPDPSIRLVGFLDADAALDGNRVPVIGGVPTLREEKELFALIAAGEVEVVVLALPWDRLGQLESLVKRLEITPVEIRLVLDTQALRLSGSISFAGRFPVLHLRDRPLSGSARAIKKMEDVVSAGLLLLFVSPLMILIAIAIKIESPGPVIFKQNRYGIGNRKILVRKFRTMYHEARDDAGELQTRPGDSRVTPLGRLLRRFSLDELPQLLNVIYGEMSVVGPRPHTAASKAGGQSFENAVAEYMARHQVKPGITGWAQVNGFRGETDTVAKLQGRVRYDLEYIANWSLWFDLKIIAKTVRCVIVGENAV